jgi:hypothetical protein
MDYLTNNLCSDCKKGIMLSSSFKMGFRPCENCKKVLEKFLNLKEGEISNTQITLLKEDENQKEKTEN